MRGTQRHVSFVTGKQRRQMLKKSMEYEEWMEEEEEEHAGENKVSSEREGGTAVNVLIG